MIKTRLYTVTEAACYLGVHAQSLRNWDRNGSFKAVKTPGGQRRYTENQLLEFLNGTNSVHDIQNN